MTTNTNGQNKMIKPEIRYYVTRDGKVLSEALANENEVFEYILKHQGQSVDWAMKHEGWGWIETQPFKEDDYGRYVCVGRNRTCGNHRDIASNGVWVKYGTEFSSAHQKCV